LRNTFYYILAVRGRSECKFSILGRPVSLDMSVTRIFETITSEKYTIWNGDPPKKLRRFKKYEHHDWDGENFPVPVWNPFQSISRTCLWELANLSNPRNHRKKKPQTAKKLSKIFNSRIDCTRIVFQTPIPKFFSPTSFYQRCQVPDNQTTLPSPPHWIWSNEIIFENLQIFNHIYSTLLFSGGGHCWKACKSRKKESKQSEITCKQSEPARIIFKIQKRREFVRALWYEQCPKNSFKRLYMVKGLLVLVKKSSFSKEFRWEFQCGGEG